MLKYFSIIFSYVFFLPSERTVSFFLEHLSAGPSMRPTLEPRDKRFSQRLGQQKYPKTSASESSFFSHGNLEPVPWFVWRKLLPIWSHLELWSFRSMIWYKLMIASCSKKQRCFPLTCCFCPAKSLELVFVLFWVLFTSDSIWVLRTSTPKHPPSREAAWNCYQNKTMDSKVNKWCPLHVCLCVYICIHLYIYTHYIHMYLLLFSRRVFKLSETKLPG